MGKFKEWLIDETQRIGLSLSKIGQHLRIGDYDGLTKYTYSALRSNMNDGEAALQAFGPQRDMVMQTYAQITDTAKSASDSWAEWYLNKKMGEDPRTPKLYYTPGVEKKDIAGLINNFRSLWESLRAVAVKHNTGFGFKIPRYLHQYVDENDRLVVHLPLMPDPQQQQSIASEIDAAIKQWASSSGVTLHPRTYSRGEDTTRSFGTRVAESFVLELKKAMQKAGLDPNQPVPANSIDNIAMWYAKMIQQNLSQGDKLLHY